MQTNFIGHGLDPTNKNTVGDQLCSSFADNRFDSFIGLTAFASIAGVKRLVPFIKDAKARFKTIRFYIGVDDNGTSKEALQCLIDNEIDTYIFHTQSAMIFHPKLYIFEGSTWDRVIIGSSNLTHSGLFVNVEASVSMDFRPDDKQGKKFLKQLNNYFKTLLNLTDSNVEKLSSELLDTLCKTGLIRDEINTRTKSAEQLKNLDDLGIFPDRDKLKVNQAELGKSTLPKENKKYQYDLAVNQNDYDVFPVYLEKYKNYTKNVRQSGVVNKNTEDRDLYTWYRRMKNFISEEILPDEFAKALAEASFPFGDGKYANSLWVWEKNYNELLAYMKFKNISYGYVPQTHNKKDPYYKLGAWYARQKQRKFNGYTPPFTEYELQKLKEIDFKWEMPNAGSEPDDDTWLENYFQLEDYKKKNNGSCHPNQIDKDPQIKKLGKWVNDQMTLKNTGRKKKNGKVVFLLKQREELLTELGVDWNHQENKNKKVLEQQIEEYLLFRKEHPNEKPKKQARDKWAKVLDWKAQTRHRKDKLPQWKIKRLDEINFPW